MFLFVHGTAATPGVWLLHIRSILGLGPSFTDRELLDVFTIALPGHPENDASFTYKEFAEWVDNVRQKKGPLQAELAKKLILTHRPEIIAALKDPKLILIGHSVGGALSLQYALMNPEKISKLVICSAGSRFSSLYMLYAKTLIRIISKLDQPTLYFLSRYAPSRRLRIAANIFAENPKRKGFYSCIKFIDSYSFKALFEQSTLDQQLAFLRIPILLVGGKFDPVAPPKVLYELVHIVDPRNPIIQRKKTIIGNKQSMVTLRIYSSFHEPMEKFPQQFALDVRRHLIGP